MYNMKKLYLLFTIFLLSVVIVNIATANNKNIQADKPPVYNNCELGDLVGDDVIRVKISKFYVDYHSEEFTKKQIKVIAKKCLEEGVSSQYQMDCCITTKIYGNK